MATILRNSIKAIIIENGRLLLTRIQYPGEEQIYYILPGGGQEPGETFHETLRRECMEELGSEIEIGDLRLIREYIGPHFNRKKRNTLHQMEYCFFARLKTLPSELLANRQAEEIGFSWIEIESLGEINLVPRRLKDIITPCGQVHGPVYMGIC